MDWSTVQKMFSQGVTQAGWGAEADHDLFGEETDTANCTITSPSFPSPSLSTPAPLPDPRYYDPVYQTVAVTLSAVVFIVGFVGNVLVVVVIARTRSMHTPTNCYLLSLSLADCLVLLAATLPAVPETFFRVDEWPFGGVLCSVLIYAQYVGVDASSLSITAFTIERYIAICHPMRAQTMCTVSRAKRITGGLWLFTALYCGPWLGLTRLVVRRLSDGSLVSSCQFRLARSSYLVFYMMDLVVFYVVPFIITTVLYGLIARILVLTSVQHARRCAGGGGSGGGSGSRSSSGRWSALPLVGRSLTRGPARENSSQSGSQQGRRGGGGSGGGGGGSGGSGGLGSGSSKRRGDSRVQVCSLGGVGRCAVVMWRGGVLC